VALAADKRARAKEISTRLEQLRQAFERAMRDDATTVRFTAAELAGVSESFLKGRKPEADGSYVLKPDPPTYDAVMINAKSEDTRKRMFVARVRRGGEGNIQVLDEAYKLRQELATLYGQPTYAHHIQRRRMVGSPDVVNKFLAEVKSTVVDVEKGELKLLAEAKARETGKPAEAAVPRWDTLYYQNIVRREKFDVDEEKTRKYFPTPKAVEFALLVSETLYGIKFSEGQGARVASGRALLRHPRRGHGQVHRQHLPRPLSSRRQAQRRVGGRRAAREHAGGAHPDVGARDQLQPRGAVAPGARDVAARVRPCAARGALQGAVLVAGGHGREARLRRGALADVRGVGTPRGVARALPQGLCRVPGAHEGRDRAPQCGAPFRAGIHYSFQHLAASFDMALSMKPEEPLALWKRLEAAQPQGTNDFTLRPASFAHVAGSGYAAGYYGYMWSEVIGLDLLSAFEKNMLDPKVGARYRETILAQGGQEEEMEMVRKFLGREPSNKAFLEEVSGKR
jgi:thimet oligopeptidase